MARTRHGPCRRVLRTADAAHEAAGCHGRPGSIPFWVCLKMKIGGDPPNGVGFPFAFAFKQTQKGGRQKRHTHRTVCSALHIKSFYCRELRLISPRIPVMYLTETPPRHPWPLPWAFASGLHRPKPTQSHPTPAIEPCVEFRNLWLTSP